MLAALLGPWDIVIIVVLIVLVFGTKRIGRAVRSLGAGGRELRRAWREDDKLPPPSE